MLFLLLELVLTWPLPRDCDLPPSLNVLFEESFSEILERSWNRNMVEVRTDLALVENDLVREDLSKLETLSP